MNHSADKTAPVIKLLWDEELNKLPQPRWLIKPILPANGLAVLYSEPGHGKTFVALDWALHMASGMDWQNRWTAVHGPSVYVASEGYLGLSRRVNAWKSYHNIPKLDRAGVAFLGTSLRLVDPENVKRFTAEIAEKEPALVVIDTLARNTAGMEENSAKEMGQAVSGCDYMREQLGCTVLVIHHSGKTTPDSPKPRLRGSSALNGAADIIISAQMEGFNVTLRCDKCKEAGRFPPITMSLMPVEDSLVLTL